MDPRRDFGANRLFSQNVELIHLFVDSFRFTAGSSLPGHIL